MANIFTIPKSNSLRFINHNELTDLQNYDNRFVAYLEYAKTLPYYYVQQFENTDSLWIQFRTNYADFTVNIVDSNNNKTLQSATLVYTDSDARNYYNVIIDTSSLSGCNYIEIIGSTFGRPYVLFRSEVFNVTDKLDNSIWIEYRGNDFGYNDQIVWPAEYQGLRLIGRDREFIPEQSKTVYDNSDYAPITLKSKPIRKMLLEINNAPYWLIEKINIGLSHDEFYVNGIRYNTDEVISPGKLGDLLTLKATITLTQLDFEDGEDKEITGEVPIFPDELRTTGLETRTTGLEDRKTNN